MDEDEVNVILTLRQIDMLNTWINDRRKRLIYSEECSIDILEDMREIQERINKL